MSFMTERYFQVLEKHKLYSLCMSEASLRVFAEHHILSAWAYRFLLKDIHQELVRNAQPLASRSEKEALRLIAEIILEEEVEEQPDGSLMSHMEVYLEAMHDLGANMDAAISFFDLMEAGVDWRLAIGQAGFPEASVACVRMVLSVLGKPLHERAAVLFYEGEPYIPDAFLANLGHHRILPKTQRLLEYFEGHIEGLKRPGFSSSGRLVEIFCQDDAEKNDEAEQAAEITMRARIELWNIMAENFEGQVAEPLVGPSRPLLRLVTPANF